jgi:hypothetical protein
MNYWRMYIGSALNVDTRKDGDNVKATVQWVIAKNERGQCACGMQRKDNGECMIGAQDTAHIKPGELCPGEGLYDIFPSKELRAAVMICDKVRRGHDMRDEAAVKLAKTVIDVFGA